MEDNNKKKSIKESIVDIFRDTIWESTREGKDLDDDYEVDFNIIYETISTLLNFKKRVTRCKVEVKDFLDTFEDNVYSNRLEVTYTHLGIVLDFLDRIGIPHKMIEIDISTLFDDEDITFTLHLNYNHNPQLIRKLVEEGTIRDWDVVFFDLVENNK